MAEALPAAEPCVVTHAICIKGEATKHADVPLCHANIFDRTTVALRGPLIVEIIIEFFET